MTYKTLFLDANILLEIIFKREKAEFCLQECLKYQLLCISPTSLHTIYYFIEKAKFDPKIVETALENIKILTFGESEYELAKDLYDGSDMEDALQMAVAINSGIKDIFSLDKDMCEKYSHRLNFIA
jgi:predicted nucleic acid-binding protein